LKRTFDYSLIWNDALSLFRTHREAIIPIAALFLFIPGWIAGLFAGQPDLEGLVTPAEMVAEFQRYYLANWPVLLTTRLVGMFGAIAIYVLLLRKDVPTVGGALALAITLFPIFFLTSLFGNFVVFGGLMLLLIPGLYLAGRLVTLGAVAVAERDRGVAEIIMRAWDMTRGKGWAAFFLTLIVTLVAGLIIMVVGLLVGILCRLVVGPAGLPFVETGVDAVMGAMVGTLMLALAAAIYRQLGTHDSHAQ
jgi:hypothetical protein